MDLTAYLLVAFITGGLLFGFGAGVFQNHVSRALESVFDSIEFVLALSRERRAAARRQSAVRQTAAAAAPPPTSPPPSPWAAHGHSAA